MKFDLRGRTRSFGNAIRGLREVFRGQANFRIHILIAITCIALAFFLDFNWSEWALLLIAIGLVLALEAMNTSVELLCNHLHPQAHPAIRTVKDIAAGAVLIGALMALGAGMVLYLPKLIAYFS